MTQKKLLKVLITMNNLNGCEEKSCALVNFLQIELRIR